MPVVMISKVIMMEWSDNVNYIILKPGCIQSYKWVVGKMKYLSRDFDLCEVCTEKQMYWLGNSVPLGSARYQIYLCWKNVALIWLKLITRIFKFIVQMAAKYFSAIEKIISYNYTMN